MRILQIANFPNQHPGSFIPMLRSLRLAAHARDWSFEAIFTAGAETSNWYADLAAEGTSLRTAPDGGRARLATWLQRVVDETRDTTVLHTHFTRFDVPAAAARSGRNDVAVVWHIHTRFGSNLMSPLRAAVKFGVLGRRVDAIICVSDDLAGAVRARLAPRSRVLALHNAVDPERFAPATECERKRARRALAIEDGVPVLLHFGWDWRIKGGDLFVATVAALAHEGIPVEALSVGAGQELRMASARLGIADRVRSIRPRDDVRQLYAASDVLISSSPAEGMPLAVLECLATGTPVVASAIPVHAEISSRVEACILAERDPQHFAAAVQRVMHARREGRALDTSGVARYADLTAWSNRVMNLYAGLRPVQV